MARLLSYADGPTLSGGFSTRAGSVSNKKSFEDKPPPPPPPQVDKELRQIEMRIVASKGDKPAANNAYPSAVETRYKATLREAVTRNRGAVSEEIRTKGGTDLDKYGVVLPRYTDPAKAAQTIHTADNYDPVQTLFRYDPETLNVEAEKEFRADPRNASKEFTPEHDINVPVYEGMLKREGAKGLFRAWRFDRRDQRREGSEPMRGSKEHGRYYMDARNYQKETGKAPTDFFNIVTARAVRVSYSIPKHPNKLSAAESIPWGENRGKGVFQVDRFETDKDGNKVAKDQINPRMVKISKTVGGGEQIIGDPDNFKFRKDDNDPQP